MWLHLRGKGHDVARCTIERLYAEQGWAGATRGKAPRTTIPAEDHDRPADLVDRDFTRHGTEPAVGGRLHLRADLGRDGLRRVHLRRVLPDDRGLARGHLDATDLVLDTLEMAIWNRARAGVTDLTGLVHHSDARQPIHLDRATPNASLDDGVDRLGRLASATPTTTPWPRRRSGSTRPN